MNLCSLQVLLQGTCPQPDVHPSRPVAVDSGGIPDRQHGGTGFRQDGSSMPVAVRHADLVDAPLLAEFQYRVALIAYPSIFPPEAPLPDPAQMALDWHRRLSGEFAPHQVGYVAELNGQLVAIVIASGDPEMPTFGHITRLYVEPGVWGRGVGRCLCDCAVAHLQDVGYEQASLWVLEHNGRARSWYERLGWSCTGERKPVYEPAGIDDVRFTRELGSFSGSKRGGHGSTRSTAEARVGEVPGRPSRWQL